MIVLTLGQPSLLYGIISVSEIPQPTCSSGHKSALVWVMLKDMVPCERYYTEYCRLPWCIDWVSRALSQYKNIFPCTGVPIVKIRQLGDCLIFIIRMTILVRWHLYIETTPILYYLWSGWVKKWQKNTHSSYGTIWPEFSPLKTALTCASFQRHYTGHEGRVFEFNIRSAARFLDFRSAARFLDFSLAVLNDGHVVNRTLPEIIDNKGTFDEYLSKLWLAMWLLMA